MSQLNWLNFCGFSSIFAQAPQTRELFKKYLGDDYNLNSPDFIAHVRRLLGGMDQCISLLDDQPTLDAQLLHLNGKHTAWGIPTNYYRVSTKTSIINSYSDELFLDKPWRTKGFFNLKSS